MDEASLDLCAAALRPRRFRKGETIFHAGDPGDALFIVADGSVKITIPSDEGSEPAILTTIGPGGFFGELSLLDGAPRSATAVALDPTATHVLRRDAFDALVDSEPALRRPCWSRWRARSGGSPRRSRISTSSTSQGASLAISCEPWRSGTAAIRPKPTRSPASIVSRGRTRRPSWPG